MQYILCGATVPSHGQKSVEKYIDRHFPNVLLALPLLCVYLHNYLSTPTGVYSHLYTFLHLVGTYVTNVFVIVIIIDYHHLQQVLAPPPPKDTPTVYRGIDSASMYLYR